MIQASTNEHGALPQPTPGVGRIPDGDSAFPDKVWPNGTGGDIEAVRAAQPDWFSPEYTYEGVLIGGNLEPVVCLLGMAVDGIELRPTIGQNIEHARGLDAIQARQRESTILLGAIVRGESIWLYVDKHHRPLGELFRDKGISAADEARDLRIYLAHRAGMLDGCTSKTQAEIRLGIRTPGGELKREWM